MCSEDMAERLRKAREHAKLTQREAADRLGITSQAISNWESGRDKPSLERIFEVAGLYRVSPTWLVTGSGSIENANGTSGSSLRILKGRIAPRLNMHTAVIERSSKAVYGQYVHTYFDCGPDTFVMDLEDSSNAPDFLPGDAVAIDPGEKPRPGDMVFAVIKPAERGVFRRYQARTELDGTKYIELSPLNPDWDRHIIRSDADGRIVGVMTEHVKPRR